MAVISIDLGTTGCKAAVFDGARILGAAYRHYDYVSREEGWAEQDANAVWLLVNNVVKQALVSSPQLPVIDAVGVSVQGDAIIPIDSKGNALHPAILGMDTRSYKEAADLQAEFGRSQLYSTMGMPCEPLNAITKIFWLERHQPGLKRQLWKYVHYGEFLFMKLAGIPALDFTMASRTMAFNPVQKGWVAPILTFVGISPSQLGDVLPSGVPIGTILASVAKEWGINNKAQVISGGHDQCMAAVGAGVIESGIACYSMGTAEVIGTCFGVPRMTTAMLDSNYPCYCHAVNDQFFTITLNQSGGLSLGWFQDLVMEMSHIAEEAHHQVTEGLIAGLELAPSSLLFLPHLVGSGTPTCDHLSRGAFLGLSLKSTRADMFQSVVDALAFEAKLNLETLESLGVHVTELRGVGGGTRSRRILELKATVLNRPICTLKTPEAALLGVAMLAQVATRQFSDLEEARRECVVIDQTIEPAEAGVSAYEAAFERFRQVYVTLKSLYHNWRTACPNTPDVSNE